MKIKKIIAILFVAVCAAMSAAILSACDTDIIGQLSHRHQWVATGETVPPTCTENGYTEYVCECGKTKRDDLTDAPGHDEVILDGKPATCTESGFKNFICARCDYSANEVIPALGHDEVLHPEKKATCMNGGYSEYVTCNCCDYCTPHDSYPSLGHDLREVEGRDASCSAVGWNDYESCSRCDYTTYEEIPKLPHAAQNIADGVLCKVACGVCEETISVTSHVFAGGECVACGFKSASYTDLYNGAYGYTYFADMNNGANMQAFYRAIDEKARIFHSDGRTLTDEDKIKATGKDEQGNAVDIWYYGIARFTFSDYGVTRDEALSVWKTYRDDKPAYYWLSNNAVYNSTLFVLCVFDDYIDGERRTELNGKLFGEAEKIIKSAPYGASAYDLARTYHDAIIKRIDYVYKGDGTPESADWAHSVRGVLEGTGAVCEGYARAFQMLLNASGVENVFVTGQSMGEEHAWNLVKLDNGGWYWFDLTWDDVPQFPGGIRYDYFCKTDADFLSSHTVADSAHGINFLYGLPSRAENDYPTASSLYSAYSTASHGLNGLRGPYLPFPSGGLHNFSFLV